MCKRAVLVAAKSRRDHKERSFRVRGTIESFRAENLNANRAEGTEYVYPNVITRSLGRYIVKLNPSTEPVVRLSTRKSVVDNDHELPELPPDVLKVCQCEVSM